MLPADFMLILSTVMQLFSSFIHSLKYVMVLAFKNDDTI